MDMPLSKLGRDARLPLYQQVREEIVEKIQNGTWSPDSAIPTEAELTKQYGVAIGTIRKAVDTLVKDGLLYRSQGRGTFVSRPDFKDSLFRFFRQTTPQGTMEVPDSKILSRNVSIPPVAAVEALNLKNGEEAICLKRKRYLESRVIFLEEIWLPKQLFSVLLDIDLNKFGNLLYPFYEQKCGLSVASAKEMLKIETADDNTAQELNIETGKPIAVIERIAFGYDKTPLEYRMSRGAAETFRYQIDIV